MHTPLPLTKDLVLVGGGHTHALVLRRWGMMPTPGVQLTLINPAPAAPYTGMLPGHVAGHYPRDALDIDLVRLARFAGARLVLGRATAIDLGARQIEVSGRAPLRYDIASLDIGITSGMPSIPGFEAHAVPAKPLDAFADRWAAFAATAPEAGRVSVIGAGIAGVELALAIRHRLPTAKITLIDRTTALSSVSRQVRDRLRSELRRIGAELVENSGVVRVRPEEVHLEDGTVVSADLVVGSAGALPHRWLEETGLELENGFISVDGHLRSVTDPRVYAVGDCAHFILSPRPKAGVYAVRAAPVLFHNLRADLCGQQRRRFHPQPDFLKLISLGDRRAVGQRGPLTVSGPWVWRWKDRIDRAFMERFSRLPCRRADPPAGTAAKGAAALASGPPPCAGCGAKLGADALDSGLAASRDTVPRPDVLPAPSDDAAIVRIGGALQVISTDHLRAFTPDPWLMGRVAAVHALGDIWAMGATPQTVLSTIILPWMTEAMQTAMLAEISAAATEVFAAHGAQIVGGHTTQGTELTVGFTVTGLVTDRPILLSSAQPGDTLILTKPIGSGTLLAAEMAMRAKGRWIAALWETMTQSQGQAAVILRHAHAMTDVTGFGLAGHLLAILRASGVGAEVDLQAIPLLSGAYALSEAGIGSTLYNANRRRAPLPPIADTARARLLHDPQTSGGLLASVEPGRAATSLSELRAAGYAAAAIGTVTDGPVEIRLH
ncbi:MAG: selenide, water dikinase SelD [Pseudomonadota bacterium]